MAEPHSIGRYNIIRELGHGGMAVVFLAHDPAMDRDVAIKVLPAQFIRDPQLRERFQYEAKIAAALQSPYITPVYDYGEDVTTGQPYLVMRYFPGGTLADRMNRRPMPLVDVVHVTLRLAAALDYAHRRNTIHRDVKPKNVLLDEDDEAALSDFGIAKLLQETSGLTASGAMVGTPHYMSPEQFMGGPLDGRSDLYSLGVMVFEMLTGWLPYQGDSAYALMTHHTHTSVPDMDTPRLQLPSASNAVVKRALAKSPADRYATAGELARALNALLAQPLPTPISSTQPFKPVVRPVVNTSAPTTPDVPTGSILGVPTPGVSLLPPTAPRESPLGVNKSELADATLRGKTKPQAMRTSITPRRSAVWRWVAGGMGSIVVLLVLGWGASFIIGQRPPPPTTTPTTSSTISATIAQTLAATRTPPPVQSSTRTAPPVQPSRTFTLMPSASPTLTSTVTRTAPPVQPSRTRTPAPPATTAPPSPTETPIPPTIPPPPPPTDTSLPPTHTSPPPTNTPPPPQPTSTPP